MDIIHNASAQRHEVTIDGQLAVVDHPRLEGRIAFTHTYVPVPLRGKGIAEKLVRSALTWARGEGVRISAECSYVAQFIRRNPEFSDLLEP